MMQSTIKLDFQLMLKKKIKGNVEWGHVMTATDLYYEKFDGNSLQDLIWNWINGSGPTKYINNN